MYFEITIFFESFPFRFLFFRWAFVFFYSSRIHNWFTLSFNVFNCEIRSSIKYWFADLYCTTVHRVLHSEDPVLLIYIYTGCKLHPGVGFWFRAPLCKAPPFFFARVPLSGFTPTALPREQQWVGHFLAALIRRVANIAGNFIRSLYPSFYYYRRSDSSVSYAVISEYDRRTQGMI
jgi:hypothetical protein